MKNDFFPTHDTWSAAVSAGPAAACSDTNDASTPLRLTLRAQPRPRAVRAAAGAAILAVLFLPQLTTAIEPTADQLAFFEKRIRPILADNCYGCHSADTKPAGGLRVDDFNGLLTGGDAGPAVVPNEPASSILLRRIRAKDPKRRMPKDAEALTDAQIADLETWIKDGAAWPRERIPASLGRIKPEYDKLKA